MNTAYVVPKSGVKVVDPKTRTALPATGCEVDLNNFWRRRIADGDVVVRDAKPETQPAKPAGKELTR